MIKFIKEHWIKFSLIVLLVILDLFMVSIHFIDAKKDITAPGGLNEVRNLIEVDTTKDIEGSFNTIYVYGYDHASILQTYIASFAEYNEISDSSTTSSLSDEERRIAGIAQKNQSIAESLICAYNYAAKTNKNINLEYKFKGFAVTYRQHNQKKLEIGDIIYAVERGNRLYNLSDLERYSEVIYNFLNTLKTGDKIFFIRNNIDHEYELLEDICKANINYINVYSQYDLNSETATPSYELHKSNTLGPSGGLMQTLSVYCQITGIDLTKGKKVCGTGTISISGNVGAIGGIS
jgi:PDZ domain-containing protein